MEIKLLKAFVQGRHELAGVSIDLNSKQVIARRRVQKMSVHELINWADVAGSGMAKGFMDYRKEGNLDSLLEIRDALVALSEVTEELIIRGEVEQQHQQV